MTSDGECDSAVRPEPRRICNNGNCPGPEDFEIGVITSNNVEGTSHWRVAPWTDVSIFPSPTSVAALVNIMEYRRLFCCTV